jgi:hypothetical protein
VAGRRGHPPSLAFLARRHVRYWPRRSDGRYLITRPHHCFGTASTPSGGIFDVAGREARIAELDAAAAGSDFWNDGERAQTVLKERAELAAPIAAWRKQLQELDDAKVFAELVDEGDPEAAAEARPAVTRAGR